MAKTGSSVVDFGATATVDLAATDCGVAVIDFGVTVIRLGSIGRADSDDVCEVVAGVAVAVAGRARLVDVVWADGKAGRKFGGPDVGAREGGSKAGERARGGAVAANRGEAAACCGTRNKTHACLRTQNKIS
jgi:hypothetical protein